MNQIKAGVVLNYLIIGLNTLVGLSYTPYMLRMLGQNEYGLYSLVASIIAYLTLLDFGFGNSIVRYTAKFRAEGEQEKQWEMFGMFTILYSIVGLIALGIGIVLCLNVDTLFHRTMSVEDLSQARTMMIFLVINLTFTFPLSIYGSIITAYEDFIFQKVVTIIRILLSTAILIALLYLGYKAVALVVTQTIFNFTVLLVNWIYCKYRLHIKVWFKGFNLPFLKEIASYSFWVFLNAIMDKVYWNTGQFVLGTVAGTIAVAVFSVAITLQNMFMAFSTSISGVLLPRVTAMVTKNASNKDISEMFITTGRLQNIVISFILCGFIVFGQCFINLWAGNGYSTSYYITLIFFVSLYTPLIQNVAINILQARSQLKFRSVCYVIIALVSLLGQIYLSKIYGSIGCSVAIGLALILGQGVIMNIYYCKKQSLDIVKFWENIFRMNVVPICITIIATIIWMNIPAHNLTSLLIAIAVFSTIYLFSLYKLSLNSYERNLLKQPVLTILKLNSKYDAP